MNGETTTAVSTAENRLPCPVRTPEGLPCTKKIPIGWTADEGHGGGHFWMSPEVAEILEGGHYDSVAAMSGRPFAWHLPEDCPGAGCELAPVGVALSSTEETRL